MGQAARGGSAQRHDVYLPTPCRALSTARARSRPSRACQRATGWAMVGAMGLKKLYSEIYERFARTRAAHKGFDFQEEPLKSVAPRSVSFRDRITWRTLNRAQRIKTIERERDRQQQDILDIKRGMPSA